MGAGDTDAHAETATWPDRGPGRRRRDPRPHRRPLRRTAPEGAPPAQRARLRPHPGRDPREAEPPPARGRGPAAHPWRGGPVRARVRLDLPGRAGVRGEGPDGSLLPVTPVP